MSRTYERSNTTVLIIQDKINVSIILWFGLRINEMHITIHIDI
jgi:hypothetical protein